MASHLEHRDSDPGGGEGAQSLHRNAFLRILPQTRQRDGKRISSTPRKAGSTLIGDMQIIREKRFESFFGVLQRIHLDFHDDLADPFRLE